MVNRNPLCRVCYLLPITIFTLCLICVDRAKAQDWSHFVRTAGHGLQMDDISATIKDASSTYLYGIEVDNDIPGRYESFLDPTEKLRAIKAMADSVYFYLEGVSGMMQYGIRFYFNTDKNSSTGYITSDFGIGASFSEISTLADGREAIEFAFAKSALGKVKDSLGFAVIDFNSVDVTRCSPHNRTGYL